MPDDVPTTVDQQEAVDDDSPVLVEAALHLPGLPLGARAYVDPRKPYIAAALERGYVFVVDERDATEGQSDHEWTRDERDG